MPKRSDKSLQLFADRHRLTMRRDECGDYYVGGKSGQVYEYNPERLAVLFLGDTIRQWNGAKKKLAAAGFELMQDCDTEGTASFDPEDADQWQVAIQVIQAKQRRVMSPTGLAQLQTAREKAAGNRQNHCNRGVSGAKLGPPDPQTTSKPIRGDLR